MKRISIQLFFCLLSVLTTFQLGAQCTDFLGPDGSAGYTNFNTGFGGAPTTINGCPQYFEITSFEVYASESYVVNNIVSGTTYAFNLCEGPGAGAWLPDFTIVSPSGTIDASGADSDSCTITWIASEGGTYQIIINEVGFCGGGENTSTDGGFPALTIITDEACDTSICQMTAGNIPADGWTNFTTLGGAPCDDGSGCDSVILDVQAWAAEAYEMPGIQAGGEYSFDICSGDGAGSWIPNFTIEAPSGAIDASGFDEGDTCRITWIASESGQYKIYINEEGSCGGGDNIGTNNGFPIITCLSGTMCDTTGMMMDTCSTMTAETEDIGAGMAIVTAEGGTAPYTYLWSDAAGQTSDTLIVDEEGEYIVLVTDAVGCTAEDTVSIMISSNQNLLGVEEVIVSPNPTKGQLFVDLYITDNSNASVQIIDINGKILSQQNVQSTQRRLDFDLSDYARGIYIVRVNAGLRSSTHRVILAD